MSEKDFTLDEIMKELHKDALLSESSDNDPYDLDRVLREVRGYASPAAERQPAQTPWNDEGKDDAAPLPEETQPSAPAPQPEADLQSEYLSMKQNREKRLREFELQADLSAPEPAAGEKVTVERSRSAVHLAPEATTPQPAKEVPVPEELPPQEEMASKEPPAAEKPAEEPDEDFGLMEEDDHFAYEEEMVDEYTSRDQIPRLREDLRKLQGRMQGKTVLLAVCTVLSLIPAFCTEVLKNPPVDFLDAQVQPMFVLGYDFVLLLVAGLGCFDLISSGLFSLLKRQPNAYSSYSLAMLATLVANIVLLAFPNKMTEASVQLFVPLFLLCMLSVPWGRTLSLRRIRQNFEKITKLKDSYAVELMLSPQKTEEFTKQRTNGEPVLVYNKKTPFLSHFMDESFGDDVSDQLPLRTLPVSLVLAVVCAGLVLLRQDGWFTAMSAFTLVLILGAGMIPLFTSNYPLFEAAQNLQEKNAGVLGNNACETFEDGNAILLDAKDLFKGTDVTLYGIKTFLDGPPVDRVILDAASILCESNSILGEVFLNIIVNRKDYLSPVDDVKYEDGMGISAWVNDRRILIGSRELMVQHSVSIPDKVYEENLATGDRHLLYLASSGSLSAIFVIGLDCNEEIREMMNDLFAEKVLSVVKTVDPIITEGVLGHAFHLPPEAFRVIPSVLHKEVAEISVSERPANGGVFNDGSIVSYVLSFLTAKRLNRSIAAGSMVYYVTSILAVLLVLAFALMHGMSQLGNVMLCLYEVITFAICLAVQHFTNRS